MVGAIVLIVIGVALAGIGISFVVDLRQNLGAGAEAAGVESPGRGRVRQTYTFLRIESRTVAWIVTIVVFLAALALIIWGIVMLASG
ncbi:hypothetical protein ACH3VR_10900 [Microbacterium sp. B2969]|uniref:Uncharacterized protein n=1 Tax=Microbacterium alkaliflavum TaxID=3248839 RepID=A0ABW7Q914_9MICO